MIPEAIYAILQTSSGVTDIIGTKVYPEIAPQGEDMPFLVYVIDENIPESSKDGPSKLDTWSINLVMFGNNFDELFTLNSECRDVLDRYKGTIGGSVIDQANYKGTESGYDNKANVFVIESEYNIREKL